MFNRYLSDDEQGFEDMYRPVEKEEKETAEDTKTTQAGAIFSHNRPDLKKIFRGIDIGNLGILPLVLLFFLLFDVEEDEKLLIIALAIVLGI